MLVGDALILNDVQGVQVDYWEVDDADRTWTEQDCKLWGSNKAALMICLSTSRVTANALVAGVYTLK